MWLARTGRLARRVALYAAGLGLAVAAGFAAQAWWRHPPLSPWHTVILAEGFRAGPAAPASFPRYLAQESRLFAELEREVIARVGTGHPLDRYAADTLPARIALTTQGASR